MYSSNDWAVIVTGDGDFACLMKYLEKNNKLCKIIVPTVKYSKLLRPYNGYILPLAAISRHISSNKKNPALGAGYAFGARLFLVVQGFGFWSQLTSRLLEGNLDCSGCCGCCGECLKSGIGVGSDCLGLCRCFCGIVEGFLVGFNLAGAVDGGLGTCDGLLNLGVGLSSSSISGVVANHFSELLIELGANCSVHMEPPSIDTLQIAMISIIHYLSIKVKPIVLIFAISRRLQNNRTN